jgi:hypothetical protein
MYPKAVSKVLDVNIKVFILRVGNIKVFFLLSF